MKFYHKQSRKLLRLCEGDQCQCMAGKLRSPQSGHEVYDPNRCLLNKKKVPFISVE